LKKFGILDAFDLSQTGWGRADADVTNLWIDWAPSLDAAWRFAACSAGGWFAAYQLYGFNPFAPLIAFLAAGLIAGGGLGRPPQSDVGLPLSSATLARSYLSCQYKQ
jgi:hypothetical protein